MNQTRPSLFAAGVAVFAGVMLLTVSVLQVLEGLSAVLADEIFVEGPQYTYQFDVTTWGWVHMLVGALGIAVASGILGGRTWGLSAGIGLAVVNILAQFLFVPYYPFWALMLIALNVLVIWALAQRMSETA